MSHSRLRGYFDTGVETQRAFAARLGISPAHLSQIVAGRVAPSLAVAVRIAGAAGIPVESLLPSPDQATAEAPTLASTDPSEEGTNR